MAHRIYNKFPVDLQPRKVVGFSIPFSGPAVFNYTYTTKDQIKSNLINYFLTNKGERIFNPSFGANLRSRLFEQITTGNVSLLQKQIEDDLKIFFPLVKLQKLEIKTDIDNNFYNVILTYNVINFGISDTININVQ